MSITEKNGLKISSLLFDFINNEVIPGTAINSDDFWIKFAKIVHELAPLNKSLIKKREESIRAVKYGLRGKIVVNGIEYKGIMANLGLYEDEVADVMNYITNSWGNKNPKMITEEEVKKVQKK